MIWKWKGGVHPWDGKAISKEKPIKDYKPTGDGVYPLCQHIGAPATPIVKKGDAVLVGQKIAEAGGFVSAPIYSAISGTVKAIEPRMTASGSRVESIVIENDGAFTEVEQTTAQPWEQLSKEEIIALIQDAGVVGMGGATFPTHVKLSPKEPEKIDYIIMNGAECEPYLTSDYRRMLEEPEHLIEGLKIMISLFPNAKGIISIENNKPDAIKLLQELTKQEEDIEVKALPTKYPQGAERQMVYASTGRYMNSDLLPADVGCIVDNVDTVRAIYDAVVNRKPLISRIVTVTGDGVVNPQNYLVPLGTSTRELIEEAGGFVGTPEKVISGGPMMGTAMFDLDVPICKGSSSILTFRKDQVSEAQPSNCINCGRCGSVCPSRLLPGKLAQFATHGDKQSFQKHYGMECCECGSCTYICPAKRHLAQNIKSMRKDILAARKKKA
jgi:electron transport complex protein RnfC